MASRFDIGKPLERSPTRLQPVSHRFFHESRFGEMLGEKFGVCFRGDWELRFHDLRNALMKSLTLVLFESVSQGFLEERVFEDIGATRRLPFAVQNVRADQLG